MDITVLYTKLNLLGRILRNFKLLCWFLWAIWSILAEFDKVSSILKFWVRFFVEFQGTRSTLTSIMVLWHSYNTFLSITSVTHSSKATMGSIRDSLKSEFWIGLLVSGSWKSMNIGVTLPIVEPREICMVFLLGE
jgi:hypothetical protein